MIFTDLQKYKHDTVGKFQILRELIETLNEENLKNEVSLEIIIAADEVFASMAQSSQNFVKKSKS